MSTSSGPSVKAEPGQKLMFGPKTFSSSNLSDLIDLDDIFDDEFFPEDVDYSTFFNDIPELSEIGSSSSMQSNLGFDSKSVPNERVRNPISADTSTIVVPLPTVIPRLPIMRRTSSTFSSSDQVAVDSKPSVPPHSSTTTGMKTAYGSVDSETNYIKIDDDDSAEAEEDSLTQQKKRKAAVSVAAKDLIERTKLERRERNREHAKTSRIRKKVLLDTLQDQMILLRSENIKLRRIVAEKIPQHAQRILQDCTSPISGLLCDFNERENDGSSSSSGYFESKKKGDKSYLDLDGSSYLDQPQRRKQFVKILMEPDYRLIESLMIAQKNFVVSDPSLPDNPIVYVSDGFMKLTGYKRDEILGRNCRFLQGPGTDQAAVDMIRKGVSEGRDISVCLLNYKADGTPFWNQFFVAAIKDAEGVIVNYVGVQCEVNSIPITDMKDRVRKLPIPISDF